MTEKELILRIKAAADAAGFTKVKDHLNSIGDIGRKAGKFVAAGFVAGGIAVAGLSANLAAAAEQQAHAVGQLQADLGLARDEAEALGAVGLDVFRNNWGGSIAEANAGVAQAKRLFRELSDNELQAVTEQAFALQDAFELGVNESLIAAQRIAGGLGVDASTAMDLIAKGVQVTGEEASEVALLFQEYSAHLGEMGISGPQALAAIQSGLEAGAFEGDKVLDMFKEMNIKLTEGSKGTRESLAELGLSGLVEDFRAGRVSGVEAFEAIQQKLREYKGEVPANLLADTLGTPAEDLTAEVVKNISLSADAIGDLDGAAVAAGDAVNNSLLPAWSNVWRSIQAGAAGVLTGGGLFGELRQGAIDTLNDLAGDVDAFFSDVQAVFSGGMQSGASDTAILNDELGIMSDDLVVVRENASGFRDEIEELRAKFLEVQDAFQEGGIVAALSEIVGFDLQPMIDQVVEVGSAAVATGEFLLEHKEIVLLAVGAYLALKTAMAINQQVDNAKKAISGTQAAWELYRKGALGAAVATGKFGTAAKLALGPVGWAVLAIGAAVALLAVAWKRDWGGIRENTMQQVEAIKQIPARLSETWESIKAGATELRQSWSERWTEIGDAVSQWWTDLKADVASIPDDFRQFGSDIIDGLLGGLQDAWAGAQNWMAEKAQALRDTFDVPFLFGSPSRTMFERGRWIMEGLALGLDYGGEGPREAMARIAREIDDVAARIPGAKAELDGLTARVQDARAQFLASSRSTVGADEAGFLADLNINAQSIAELEAMLRTLTDAGDFDRAQELWKRYYDGVMAQSKAAHDAAISDLESEAARRVEAAEDEIDRIKRLQDVRREGQAGANKDGEVIEIKNLSAEIDAVAQRFYELGLLIAPTKDALEQFYSTQTGGANTAIERSEDLLDVLGLLRDAVKERAESGIEDAKAAHDITMAGYQDQLRFLDLLIEDRAHAEQEYQDLLKLRADLMKAYADQIKRQQRAQEEGERRIHDHVMGWIDARREQEELVHSVRMANLDARMEGAEAAHDATMAHLDSEIAKIEDRYDLQEQRIADLEDDLDILEIDLGIADQIAEIGKLEEELERLRVVADSFQVALTGRDHLDEIRRVQTERTRATTEEQRALIQAALDSGNLDEHLTRQAELALHGYKIRVADMEAITGSYIDSVENQLGAARTELALRQRILDARRAEIDAAKLALAKDQQRNRDNLAALQERREAEQQRWATQKANIAGEIEAEKQRHQIQIDHFDYIAERQKERHQQRMADIAAEAAFQLAMLGHSQAEIDAMIQAAMDQAEHIRQRALEVIAELERQAPVVGGGSSIGPQQPPQLPPGVTPPQQPPFPQPDPVSPDSIHVEASGPDAVVFDEGAVISEGTIEHVELGGVYVEGTTVVVQIDGRDFAAQVVEEIEGDAELKDKLGKSLSERASQTTVAP